MAHTSRPSLGALALPGPTPAQAMGLLCPSSSASPSLCRPHPGLQVLMWVLQSSMMVPLVTASHQTSGPAARLHDTKLAPADLQGAGLTWPPWSPALVGTGRGEWGSLLYFYQEVSSQVCKGDSKWIYKYLSQGRGKQKLPGLHLLLVTPPPWAPTHPGASRHLGPPRPAHPLLLSGVCLARSLLGPHQL